MSRLVSSRKKRGGKKKIIKIILIVLGVALIGVLVWRTIVARNSANQTLIEDGINFGPPTEEEIQLGQDISQAVEDGRDEMGNIIQDPTEQLDIHITHVSLANSQLSIRTQIDQIISGTCTISVKRGNNQIHTETVEIAQSTSFSSCKGFDIENIPENQKYNITITVNSGDGRDKDVNVEI